MKTLLSLLIASLLSADTVQTNFKAVYFYGNTLEEVQLVLNKDDHTFTIWYKGQPLNNRLMIVSCKAPEKFCLVRTTGYTGWNK